MFDIHRKSIQFGAEELTLETGRIARQADGSILVGYGETMVMVMATAEKFMRPGVDFFPLGVHFQEKTWAAGRIPGGFIKRETRPSEKAILTSRLIDRPLRPLFPKSFRYDTQVVATVVSYDGKNSADIPAMVGASAALAISGMPFMGPIAGARVGFIDGEYVLNPTVEQLEESRLNLIGAGTTDAVTMVESGADFLTEEQMLDAIMFGFEGFQPVIKTIQELADACGKPRWGDEELPPDDESLLGEIRSGYEQEIKSAYAASDKMARQAAMNAACEQAVEKLGSTEAGEDRSDEVKALFKKVQSGIMREQVLSGGSRIDGRSLTDVRPIDCQVSILPRVHGTARPVVSARRNDARSATAPWPPAPSFRYCRIGRNFPTPCAPSPR